MALFCGAGIQPQTAECIVIGEITSRDLIVVLNKTGGERREALAAHLNQSAMESWAAWVLALSQRALRAGHSLLCHPYFLRVASTELIFASALHLQINGFMLAFSPPPSYALFSTPLSIQGRCRA
jgi:hypothetical protein